MNSLTKAILPLLSLIAVSPALNAAEKPDGILGVDLLSAGYTYYHDDYGHYRVADQCAYSLNLLLNKNLWSNADFGLDARVRYFYVANLSGSNLYDMEEHNGELGANFFMKGRIRPFVGVSTYYRHDEIEDKETGMNSTDNSWQLEGRAGAEFVITNGLSANLQISETHTCKSVSPKNITRYGATVAYWVSDRVGLTLGESYTPHEHVDSYSTLFTVMYRY
jgi:hypothetical protein